MKKELQRLEDLTESQSIQIREMYSEILYLQTQLDLWKKKKVMFCKEYCDNLKIN